MNIAKRAINALGRFEGCKGSYFALGRFCKGIPAFCKRVLEAVKPQFVAFAPKDTEAP